MKDDRARIRRGAQPRKRQPAKPRARKKQQQRALALVPAPIMRVARTAGRWAMVLVPIAVVVTGVVAMKLPQMIGTELGEVAGRAGFAVKRIEITGIDRMDRKPVEDAALAQQERAMPLVDLDAIRGQLLQQGWVADARVSRRLPDTLVVDIVERQPAAIWQHQRRLMLVDAQGTKIEQVRLEGTPLPDLPIVIGPGANLRLAELEELMKASPALKPVLDGATWVGNRRWDIRFRSGETLSLPEGAKEARAALLEFAQEDSSKRLLGRGFLRFDMRVPGKFVVRVPRAADSKPIPTSIATPVADDDQDSSKNT